MSDKLNDKIAQMPTTEKRFHSGGIKRMDGEESRGLEGVACKMEVVYDMGWYEEIIHRGAFDKALQNSDARCLFNHGSSHLLGRQSAGTLEVWVENDELKYRVAELPNTSCGNDVKIMLERGDLKESSFQFRIEKQRWEEIQEGDNWRYIRHIDEVKVLMDVAPVTFPANPDTSVAKRSFEAYQAEKPPTAKRQNTDYQLNNRKLRMRLL